MKLKVCEIFPAPLVGTELVAPFGDPVRVTEIVEVPTGITVHGIPPQPLSGSSMMAKPGIAAWPLDLVGAAFRF